MWKERHHHFSSVFLQRIAVRLWCEWALWWCKFRIMWNSTFHHSWPLSWDHYTPSVACGGNSNLAEFTQGLSRFLLFKENKIQNCSLCHAKSSVWLLCMLARSYIWWGVGEWSYVQGLMQGKQNYVGNRWASIYIVYLPAQLLLDLEVGMYPLWMGASKGLLYDPCSGMLR